MDINLARTFLMVTETGSFIEAARRLNLTQSTVSARIKVLEANLGRALFDRSKSGATLTPAGEQFRRHALTLVRVWQHAQMEIGLTEQHQDLMAAGAPPSLWAGFLLRWVGWMRTGMPEIAVSAFAAQSQVLTQRLVEGTLDIAIMYRPMPPPGLEVEHLFDEEFVLVTAGGGQGRRQASSFMSLEWCPELRIDQAAAYPDRAAPEVHLDIGTAGLDYLIAHDATGYAPLRLVRQQLARGRLRLVPTARKFVYPVGAVYPETRNEEAFEPILKGLRNIAQRLDTGSAPASRGRRAAAARAVHTVGRTSKPVPAKPGSGKSAPE